MGLTSALLMMGGGLAAPMPSVLHGTSVSLPTQGQQTNTVVPVPVVNETEKERFDRLRGMRPRYRMLWDGKNRRPGDRAHKRMKRARACGRP